MTMDAPEAKDLAKTWVAVFDGTLPMVCVAAAGGVRSWFEPLAASPAAASK